MTEKDEKTLATALAQDPLAAQRGISRVVIYASYPKTGSTMLPDVLSEMERRSISQIQRFTCLGGKSNALIANELDQSYTLLLKTHETIGRWLRVIRKKADEEPLLIKLLQGVEFGTEDFFSNRKIKVVYLVRNPFTTLLSALRYVKILWQRPDLVTEWKADGRAERLFFRLLGMSSLPTADEIQRHSILDFPSDKLEALLWRYLESGGSIPVFEEEDKPSYFAHVNYFATLLESGFDGVLLNYEGLMAQDTTTIGAIASLLGVPSMKLREALGKEIEVKVVRRSSRNNFYGDFLTRTPEKIVKLRSWPEMKRYVAAACPSLAELC